VPPLRLWIFNHHAATPGQGTGTRHFDLASELAGGGVQVTVFAAGFNHFTGREEQLHGRQLYRTQVVSGVRFVWLRTVPYRRNDVRRVLSMISYFGMVLWVQARFERPSHVIGSTVHPLAALAGYLVARSRRAAFIFEIRDLWPQTLIDLGVIREQSGAARGLRWLERLLVERADAVIALLPGIVDYLREREMKPRHLAYIPNGVSLQHRAESPPTPKTSELVHQISQWRAAGRFVVVYTGAHAAHNRLEIVLDAAALLSAQGANQIVFLLVGDGPDKPALAGRLATNPTENVFLHDPVPKADVPHLLAAVDACLVHMTRTAVYRYGISFNKVFDYLASQRPVIFACDSRNDPVRDADAGISIPPDDPASLASAAVQLAEMDPSARRRLGENGRRYVEEHHDIRHLATRLRKEVLQR
jgi:glycosyltransferase involved in cell wall biosynthesis